MGISAGLAPMPSTDLRVYCRTCNSPNHKPMEPFCCFNVFIFFWIDPQHGLEKNVHNPGKCTRPLQAENSSIRRFSSPRSGISVLQLQIWRFVLQLVGWNSCSYSASIFLSGTGGFPNVSCLSNFLKCQHSKPGPRRLLEQQ